MSRPAEELLEFDRLKSIVGGFTTCVPGRRAVEALTPQQDAVALGAEFELVREAIAYLRAGSELGFGSLADPAAWLARLLVPGTVLTIAELLDVVSLMETVGGVRQTLRSEGEKYPRLAQRAAALADFRQLSAAIRRAILPNGEISDDASPQLKRIRAGIAQAREKIQRSLEGILRARGEASGEKGEDYITLRNDRFVIPVRASERRSVPGVVHGASGTGQTIFVEPLEAIDLNNRLVQLSDEEIAEIARILEELTERVRAGARAARRCGAEIAHLDSIFARARFAREFDCTVPEFAQGNSLRLEAARNPVLEATLRPQGLKAVPMAFALGGGETVMVISGPNTGGKTVALKTTGLAALSAQSAIPVAAERAELPIFDRVLADIGDEQSIAANLSTFSAHMLNLKSMLDVATERSLILVDEMGTGTAPEEGAALAVALLEEFRARRALTLATTHHDRLKAYASTTPGIVNAAMEFDEEHLRPTYRLLVGVPGTSSGIEIARRLGLPARVVEHAQASLSPESREARDLIAYLHRSRDEMEDVKRQAREELAQLEEERRVAADGMGRAAAETHRRTREKFSRSAKAARGRGRARGRGCEGSRAARPARKTDGPPHGQVRIGREGRSGCGRRRNARIFAGGPRRGDCGAAGSRCAGTAFGGPANYGERIQAAGRLPAARRAHGRSASGAAADESPAGGCRRNRK